MSSVVQGFTKCLAMTVLSEIGDKTFFAAVDANWKANAGKHKEENKYVDESKKKRRFSVAVLLSDNLKAFSVTFFGEWGDKSQIAKIGLAADENLFGVILGGIFGRALCTTAAIVGGKSLASQISKRMVALSGGVLFIIFGIQSFLSTAGQ